MVLCAHLSAGSDPCLRTRTPPCRQRWAPTRRASAGRYAATQARRRPVPAGTTEWPPAGGDRSQLFKGGRDLCSRDLASYRDGTFVRWIASVRQRSRYSRAISYNLKTTKVTAGPAAPKNLSAGSPSARRRPSSCRRSSAARLIIIILYYITYRLHGHERHFTRQNTDF